MTGRMGSEESRSRVEWNSVKYGRTWGMSLPSQTVLRHRFATLALRAAVSPRTAADFSLR